MAVYSYYYGASPEQGIGIRAQSPELERLPLAADLKGLASLHALDSSEHSGEMMSFLLEREGYSILGVSYIETPKASGYSRSAPCSLQYIAPKQELADASGELSRIINFVNFQKPGSSTPAPMKSWPVNESGYCYHNSPSVLAPLVDGLVRAVTAAPGSKEPLLIGLPKGKNSEYAFARYTIAELLAYLPVQLRADVRFFTGLPVAEGGDAVTGFDNAVKYGANVIFCPNEFYAKILSSRTCIGVDMEAPGRGFGAFAGYISRVPDISDGLVSVVDNLGGKITCDSLNRAAQQVASGNAVTVAKLREEISRRDGQIREMEQQIENGNREYNKLKQDYEKLENRNRQIEARSRDAYDRRRRGTSKVTQWIVIGLVALALIAASVAVTILIMNGKTAQPAAAPAQSVAVTPAPPAAPTPEDTGATPEQENSGETPEQESAAPAPEQEGNLPEGGEGEGVTETTDNGNAPEGGEDEGLTETTDNGNAPEGGEDEGLTETTDNGNAPEGEEDEGGTDTANAGAAPEEQTAPPQITAKKNLSTKSKNAENEIRELQANLRYWGYYEGEPNGDFDEETEKAVKAFQKANGLKDDGVVGEKTREKLNSSNAVSAE